MDTWTVIREPYLALRIFSFVSANNSGRMKGSFLGSCLKEIDI